MAILNRCVAAHVADPRDCEGSREAVRVVDVAGGEATGCVLHGAVLLASLYAARVYPGPAGTDGAAIEAYRRAQTLAPFDFLYGPGVARVMAVPAAAVFPHGDDCWDAASVAGGDW